MVSSRTRATWLPQPVGLGVVGWSSFSRESTQHKQHSTSQEHHSTSPLYDMATSEEEVKECFKVFDTDNDSKIAISEIGLVIRALGTSSPSSSFFSLSGSRASFLLFVLLVPRPLLFLHLLYFKRLSSSIFICYLPDPFCCSLFSLRVSLGQLGWMSPEAQVVAYWWYLSTS